MLFIVGECTPPSMDKPMFEAFPLTTKAVWLKAANANQNQERLTGPAAHQWFTDVPSDTQVWLAKGRKKVSMQDTLFSVSVIMYSGRWLHVSESDRTGY